MYEFLTDMELRGDADAIIDALRQIADDIESGLDSGSTEFGEWSLNELDADEEDDDFDHESDDFIPESLNFDDQETEYTEEEDDIDLIGESDDEIVDDFEDPYIAEYRRRKRSRNDSDYDENDAAWKD